MRRFWIILAASLLASPALSQETVDLEARAAAFEQRKGDFDYLLGEWRFTAQHAEWGEGSGLWTAVRLPTGDGSHILDEYRLIGQAGETIYLSTTFRAYNEATGLWELVSAERGAGLQDIGTARKVGEEMHIEQRFGVTSDRPSLWRIRYYDIRPDRFSWAADVSTDEGATWQREYLRIQAHRIGPARSLDPLTRPRPGQR